MGLPSFLEDIDVRYEFVRHLLTLLSYLYTSSRQLIALSRPNETTGVDNWADYGVKERKKERRKKKKSLVTLPLSSDNGLPHVVFNLDGWRCSVNCPGRDHSSRGSINPSLLQSNRRAGLRWLNSVCYDSTKTYQAALLRKKNRLQNACAHLGTLTKIVNRAQRGMSRRF